MVKQGKNGNLIGNFVWENTYFWAHPDIPLGLKGLVDFNNIFM
jgi:hypothetical protein